MAAYLLLIILVYVLYKEGSFCMIMYPEISTLHVDVRRSHFLSFSSLSDTVEYNA